MSGNWDGNIEDARESVSENLSSEGSDGNRTYSESGTYGQSDYTVRERGDGKSDVYVKSDSSKGHSHDVIDDNGNIIAKYHDYALSILESLSFSELQYLEAISNNKYIKNSAKHLMSKVTVNDSIAKNSFIRRR